MRTDERSVRRAVGVEGERARWTAHGSATYSIEIPFLVTELARLLPEG